MFRGNEVVKNSRITCKPSRETISSFLKAGSIEWLVEPRQSAILSILQLFVC